MRHGESPKDELELDFLGHGSSQPDHIGNYEEAPSI